MNKNLKIKVCGLRDPLNIDEICALHPDYIGFIFYPPSKRYIKDITDGKALEFIPKNIARTGVFVNADEKIVLENIPRYSLNALQLHGDESPGYCYFFKNQGLTVIKAFHIIDNFNFANLKDYMDCCDYFLFDTKTAGYGGSGIKFGWEILNNYNLNKPFFLSGGIDIGDVGSIKKIDHPAFYAVDINSRF